LLRARLTGDIEWRAIEDSTRPIQLGGGFSTADEFIQQETPEVFVIGGNITNCWSLFMDRVIHNLSNSLVKVPVIQKSTLGESSALIGGACCFKTNASVFSN
jgi:hypothetical protein